MGHAGQTAASPAFVMALYHTCTAVSTTSTLSALAVTHPALLCRTEQGLALKDLSFTWGFTGPKRQVPTSVVQRLPMSQCHQHLGQCEPGPHKWLIPTRKMWTKQPPWSPTHTPWWLADISAMAFCVNFHGSYQKYVEFLQQASLCASRWEQDSIKPLMQALARDSLSITSRCACWAADSSSSTKLKREKAELDWAFVFTSVL